MTDDVDYRAAFNKALRMLARRDHTKNELKKKLANRIDDCHVLTNVLNQLEKDGYINDYAFASKYLRYRSGLGFGPRKIYYELQSKGVDKENIRDSFKNFEVDWIDITKSAFQKKFGEIDNQNKTQRSHEKEIRFLVQRGFIYDDIKTVLGGDL